MTLIKTLAILLILLPAFAHSEVKTFEVSEDSIKGVFDVVVFSNAFINDPETLILLDRVDDGSTIRPYAPDFKFTVYQNLSESEALKIVRQLLNSQSSISGYRIIEIRHFEKSLGFEIRPLYWPWIFGVSETLETLYRKRGNTVEVFIRLKSQVERQLNSGDTIERDD